MPDQFQLTPRETVQVVERTSEALVVEATYAPGASPPPAHYHPAQKKEHFEVVQGALRVVVAGVERDLQAGETLEIPPATPHKMWNPTGTQARVRWETIPPGRRWNGFRRSRACKAAAMSITEVCPNRCRSQHSQAAMWTPSGSRSGPTWPVALRSPSSG